MRIGVSATPAKISPELIQKTGIISNDTVLNKEEFKALVAPGIIANWDVHKQALLAVQTNLVQQNFAEAYKLWMGSIYNNMLGNKVPVSLALIDNVGVSKAGSSRNAYYGVDMGSYITSQGQILETTTALSKLPVNVVLQEHLDDLLRTLDTPATYDDAIEITIQSKHNSDIKEQMVARAWQAVSVKRNLVKSRKRYIFYGGNRSWTGQAADAFFNHMVHHHANLLFSTLNNESIQDDNIQYSVWEEEKLNIYALLAQGANKTAWYTGGDVFVRYQNFVFNIQLKTKRSDYKDGLITSPYYQIAHRNLSLLIGALTTMNATVDNLVDVMWNTRFGMVTSGFIEQDLARSISEQATEIINMPIKNLTK